MNKLNAYRNIADDDDPQELIKFEHAVRRLVKKFDYRKVLEHFDQATVDLCEEQFGQKVNLKKGKYSSDRKGYTGDHVSMWEGNDGTVVRSDEYPMSWDEVVERIQKNKERGLDGYITGQSIHFPGITFGIVAFEKGKYHTRPGI
jgi:hypothetical protein